MHGHGALFAR